MPASAASSLFGHDAEAEHDEVGRRARRAVVCTTPSSKPVTSTPVRRSIPKRRTASSTRPAMSGSRVRMTVGFDLDEGRPWRRGARTPRPSRGRCSRRRRRRPGGSRSSGRGRGGASASPRVCTPWTNGRSMPGRSGRSGRAPVPMWRRSKPRTTCGRARGCGPRPCRRRGRCRSPRGASGRRCGGRRGSCCGVRATRASTPPSTTPPTRYGMPQAE